MKIDLISLNVDEIKEILVKNDIKGYIAGQIFNFIHKNLIFDFDKFHNISKENREKLKELFFIPEYKLITTAVSDDKKTKKYLFLINKKMLLETVLLVHNNRNTLCVSSQVGCPLACDFCATGTMKFEKNLTASEIVMQYYIVSKELEKENKKISNLVYMGMGEPFLNYDNVIKSINILANEKGQNLSKRNFTVSTSGLVKEIMKIADDERQIHLAISLHSAIDETRNIIMPINKRYNLEKLKEALKYYQKQTKNRITFEYILIDKMNISNEEAEKLIEFLKEFNSHVNLIPYNRVEGKPYETPSINLQKKFFDKLRKAGINVTLRETKGQDIAAACGQLKVKKENENNEKNS